MKKVAVNLLKKEKRTFAHGVHPPECKEATAGRPIRRLAFPPQVIVPLQQHTGVPAVPVVREGQEVVRGEPIAKAGGFVSVPMHAPVTGVVHYIGLGPSPTGAMTPSIFIKAYPGATQEILYGAPREIDRMTPEELVLAVQDTGMVGLGGAAFPTHVKLAVPKGKQVDTLIINGCECEPYLTTDHRVMIERAEDILAGVVVAARAVGAQRVIAGVEDNKPDAVEALKSALTRCPLQTEVIPLPTKYPQGAEKMLTKALLGREVPSGGLPVDIGTVIMNVATLAQIGDLLPKHQGLIERVVTITGPGVLKPGNYLMPLGTPLWFALEYAGFTGKANQVVFGGPMMGMAISSLATPITKGVTGIVAFTEPVGDGAERPVYPCIKCGSCVDACPIHLNPSRLGLLARKGQYQAMEEEFHLNDCFECGCCSFVCPSGIPLVHYFRVAKTANRQRRAREKAAASSGGNS
ncbi:MAG TPA: electron transport complex subunit RsxC [Candidatus Hydrogenedentes bacterium]|nr:electron transport complex subunit RsxC [Candidatus Hydrogenedentota bacterium]